MKRTIHISKPLGEYIEKMKANGQSPSTTINKLYEEYEKLNNNNMNKDPH